MKSPGVAQHARKVRAVACVATRKALRSRLACVRGMHTPPVHVQQYVPLHFNICRQDIEHALECLQALYIKAFRVVFEVTLGTCMRVRCAGIGSLHRVDSASRRGQGKKNRIHVLTQKKTVIRFRADAFMRERVIKPIATTRCTPATSARAHMSVGAGALSSEGTGVRATSGSRVQIHPRSPHAVCTIALHRAMHGQDTSISARTRASHARAVSWRRSAVSDPTRICVGGTSRVIPAALFYWAVSPIDH